MLDSTSPPHGLSEPWAPPYGAVDGASAVLYSDCISDSSPGDGTPSLAGPGFGSIPATDLHDGQLLSAGSYATASGNMMDGGDVYQQVRGAAFSLLEGHSQAPDGLLSCAATRDGTDTLCSWLRSLTWTAASPAASPAASSFDPAQLSSVPTYIALISRFTLCLNSQTDMTSPYADVSVFAPRCLQMSLLRHVALYTSACFLSEAKHVDRMAAAAHTSRTMAYLTSQLPTTPVAPSPSDAAILAAVQLVMNEWYPGETGGLHTRLGCLYDMFCARGGSKLMGVNGLISKLAIATIYLSGIHGSSMAMTVGLDMWQHLRVGSGPGCQSASAAPFPLRVAHNTPLVAPLLSFEQCAEALGMHPTVASILDDMRFLVEAVLELPQEPSGKEMQKIRTTAQWIRNRLELLPAEASSPDALYQAVRQVGLVYCAAILARRPFRAVVQADDFQRLWTAAWRVSLVAWRGVLGVFMWITLAVVASARGDRPPEALARSMLSACTVQMSLESWDMAVRALQAALRLDAWLQGGFNYRGEWRTADDE